jgi:TolA-binding protein
VNPASGYAAEALMIAADCRLRKGDKTGARDTYKRVLAEYPESPLVADALKQLEELK